MYICIYIHISLPPYPRMGNLFEDWNGGCSIYFSQDDSKKRLKVDTNDAVSRRCRPWDRLKDCHHCWIDIKIERIVSNGSWQERVEHLMKGKSKSVVEARVPIRSLTRLHFPKRQGLSTPCSQAPNPDGFVAPAGWQRWGAWQRLLVVSIFLRMFSMDFPLFSLQPDF